MTWGYYVVLFEEQCSPVTKRCLSPHSRVPGSDGAGHCNVGLRGPTPQRVTGRCFAGFSLNIQEITPRDYLNKIKVVLRVYWQPCDGSGIRGSRLPRTPPVPARSRRSQRPPPAPGLGADGRTDGRAFLRLESVIPAEKPGRGIYVGTTQTLSKSPQSSLNSSYSSL